MRLALAIFISVLLAQEVQLKIPDGVKEQEVQDSVKALSARISQYGFKELAVSVGADKQHLTVKSAAPITDMLNMRLKQLSAIKAQEIDLRFVYEMSQAETEQFKPGGAAPKGVKWIHWKGGWASFLEEPSFSVKGQIIWYPKKKSGIYDKEIFGESHLSFGQVISKKLVDIPAPQIAKMRLFVDGELIEMGGMFYQNPRNARWVIGVWGDWDTLGPSVNNPMPFGLTLGK